MSAEDKKMSALSSSWHSSNATVMLLLLGSASWCVFINTCQWEFSFLLTFGQALLALGSAQLCVDLHNGMEVGPISVQGLKLTTWGLALRLIPTVLLDGYLPRQSTFHIACDVFSLLFTLVALLLAQDRAAGAAARASTGIKEFQWFTPLVLAVCSVCAVFLHGDMDDSPIFDTLWALATYTLSFAPLPQLIQVQFAPPESGWLPWTYLLPAYGSTVFWCLFWFTSREELYHADDEGVVTSEAPGKAVFISCVMCLIFSTQCIGHNAMRYARSPKQELGGRPAGSFFV